VRIHCQLDPSALPAPAARILREGLVGDAVSYAGAYDNLVAAREPVPEGVEIVFGQPDPKALPASVRWVHLSSAGYARYEGVGGGWALTTSSSVYADPCAEQCLAAMLAHGRRLPAMAEDALARRWRHRHHRDRMRLLRGSRVLLLGHGAIGRRLLALLAPFEVEATVLRRRPTGDEGVAATTAEALDGADGWSGFDHVVSSLPGSAGRVLDARRLARLGPQAFVYNVGRGNTLDAGALVELLTDGRLAGAWLDVFEEEPLPEDSPLWTTPGLTVTPHAAGGRPGERAALMTHFLENLERWRSDTPLLDRVR
jgi:phosphoglycerate dehydrogenase-like enzyme